MGWLLPFPWHMDPGPWGTLNLHISQEFGGAHLPVQGSPGGDRHTTNINVNSAPWSLDLGPLER